MQLRPFLCFFRRLIEMSDELQSVGITGVNFRQNHHCRAEMFFDTFQTRRTHCILFLFFRVATSTSPASVTMVCHIVGRSPESKTALFEVFSLCFLYSSFFKMVAGSL